MEIQAANLTDSVANDITVYPATMDDGVATGECYGTATVINGVCFFQNNTGEASWADVQTYLAANGGVEQAYLVQDAGSATVNNPYNAVIDALSWDGQALIPAPHSVPSVVGERANPALASLTAAGLTGATSPARNPLFVYVVTAESPAAGTLVAPGTKVTLTVAKATASVTVPKVIGQRANPGLATLRAAGLMAVTNPLRKSTGTYVITSESPAAGTKVTPGAKIVVGVKLVS
jgi:serine/threonine-protein kinase